MRIFTACLVFRIEQTATLTTLHEDIWMMVKANDEREAMNLLFWEGENREENMVDIQNR